LPDKTFNAAFIRQAARDAGGQAEIARLLGVSKEAVRLWCDGRCVPAPEYVAALGHEFGLAPASAWLVPQRPAAAPRELIRRLLRLPKLSLREIARAARVPLGTISEIRSGKRSGFSQPEHDAALRDFAAGKLAGGAGDTSSWAAAERARRSTCRRSQMNLSTDVVKFFGLTDDPWRLDVRRDSDVFPTKDYRRMHKTLTRAVERRDFAIVSGATGSGKSVAAQHVLREVCKRKSVQLIPILAPDVRQVKASTLCDALVKHLAPKTRPEVRTEKLAIQVCNLLIEHHRAGRTPVILIDDAHNCTPTTISQLKKFYEFRDVAGRDPYEPLMAIILLGWPELGVTLRNNVTLLEVARRADMIELRGLTGEHRDYILRKLKRVGANGKVIFQAAAVAELRRAPQAHWPLAVNRIASRAMFLAWDDRNARPAKTRGQVTADDVRQAARDEV